MPNDDPDDYNGTVARLPMDFYGSDDTDVSNEYGIRFLLNAAYKVLNC